MRKGVAGILIGISALAVLTVCIVLGMIAGGARSDPEASGDYIIILGCGLDGAAPSKCLLSRLDTALEYLKQRPEAPVVVSGSQGSNEDVSEAEAMETYLIQKGVKPSRIIKEDRSHSTYQNLVYSKQILDDRFGPGKKSAVLITNDFHLYRSKFMAKRLGFEASGIAAPTPPEQAIPNWIREVCTVLAAWGQFAVKG